MRIDYEYLKDINDVHELRDAIKILNKKLYDCQEALYSVWGASNKSESEPGYGWPVGELAGCYDLLAKETIANFENTIGWLQDELWESY